MDYRLYLMAGVDIPIEELALVAHSPTIKEIAMMGRQNFFTAMQYLCLEKEQFVQDKSILESLNNFQVLMEVLEQSKDKNKKVAIHTLLMLMFPKYRVIMTPRGINFIPQMENPQTLMIDANNFNTFQEAIKEILSARSMLQGDNVVYNPGNAKAKEIADKMMKNRMRIAQQKQGNKNECVLTRYISILTVAKIATLEDCLKYNLFQLFDQMERYSAYMEWDIDLRVRLAGGTPDKTVDSWMRDLYSETSSAVYSASDDSSNIKVYHT